MRFRSTPHEIRASIVPLMTPFTPDGAVAHESLANLIEWQLANGTHGVSIGGSTGEPGGPSGGERAPAIETVTSAVADRVPVVVGTGTAQLHETIELTARAVEAGIDASLIITPY